MTQPASAPRPGLLAAVNALQGVVGGSLLLDPDPLCALSGLAVVLLAAAGAWLAKQAGQAASGPVGEALEEGAEELAGAVPRPSAEQAARSAGKAGQAIGLVASKALAALPSLASAFLAAIKRGR